MPKLLFFFPGNPLICNAGNNSRANTLLHYFKSRNFTTDFILEENFEFNDSDIQKLKKEYSVYEVFVLEKQNNKGIDYLINHSIANKLSGKPKYLYRAQNKLKKQFKQIAENNEYDFIVISYACWLTLAENLNVNGTKIIVDTHDFLTSQFQETKNFKLGSYFEAEINLLNIADIIWTISGEEKYLFSQFLDKQIDVIPHSLKAATTNNFVKEFDLIYVGSDNPHNIKAANWFFNKVLPLITIEVKILVIGKITKHIPDNDAIKKIDFAENLTEYYQKSKIAICPMLSGTGLKIKTIEALSFGLPVVCNEQGVDGLINKTNNGCIIANEPKAFAKAIEDLLKNESLYDEIQHEAIDFFATHYATEKVFSTIDNSLKLNR